MKGEIIFSKCLYNYLLFSNILIMATLSPNLNMKANILVNGIQKNLFYQ